MQNAAYRDNPLDTLPELLLTHFCPVFNAAFCVVIRYNLAFDLLQTLPPAFRWAKIAVFILF